MRTQNEIIEANLRNSMHCDGAKCRCGLCGNLLKIPAGRSISDIAASFALDVDGDGFVYVLAHRDCISDLLASITPPPPPGFQG